GPHDDVVILPVDHAGFLTAFVSGPATYRGGDPVSAQTVVPGDGLLPRLHACRHDTPQSDGQDAADRPPAACGARTVGACRTAPIIFSHENRAVAGTVPARG